MTRLSYPPTCWAEPAAVSLVRPWIRNRETATSVLVYGEVLEYFTGRQDFERRHAELRDLTAEVTPHFVTYAIVGRYADIRRRLRPSHGGPGLIGDIDTLIAATAMERNLAVVTADTDFEKVPELKVQLIPRDALSAR